MELRSTLKHPGDSDVTVINVGPPGDGAAATPPVTLDDVVNVRLDPADLAALDAVVADWRSTRSDVVRKALRAFVGSMDSA